jgi:aspartate racemase
MSKLNHKVIGVIGGMGPTCSANFFQQLIYQLNKRGIKQDSDFPEIILLSLPLPETHWNETGFIYKSKKENKPILNKIKYCLKKLKKCDVELIVIPCNTIHYLIDEIKAMTDIPILSIVDVLSEKIEQKNYKYVGLFCTESTKELDIYKKIEPIHMSDNEQKLSTSLIKNIMFGCETSKDKIKFKKSLENKYKNENLDAVIIGCTELSLLISQSDTKVPIIDTSIILAEELADRISK